MKSISKIIRHVAGNPVVRRASRDERGIALIMSIGVMMLLVGLTLAFVTSSLNNLRISEYNNESVIVDMHLNSALSNLQLFLQTEFQDASQDKNLYPASKGTTGAGFARVTESEVADTSRWGDDRVFWIRTVPAAETATDMLGEVMTMNVPGEFYIKPPGTSGGTMLTSALSWVNIYRDAADSEIVGRYCMILVDESGKIDPTSCVDSGVNEGQERGSKIGVHPKEIDLSAVFTSDPVAKGFQIDNSDTTSAGFLDPNHTWDSFEKMLLGNKEVNTTAEIDEVLYGSVFPYSFTIESYFDGTTNLHRYNLGHTNWNAFGNNIDSPVNNMVLSDASPFWESSSKGSIIGANTGGISWFNAVLSDSSATSEKKLQIRQIVANLIDYCDADTVATVDSNLDPVYVGLEKVPYINELAFKSEINQSAADPTQYELVISCVPELVNIYEDAGPAGSELKVTFSVGHSAMAQTQYSMVWTTVPSISGKSYYEMTGKTQVISLGTTSSVSGLIIYEAKAWLYKPLGTSGDVVNSEIWDVSRATTPSEPSSGGVAQAYLDLPLWASIETDDPRYNLSNDQWAWHNWTDGGTVKSWSTDQTIHSLDAKNYNCRALRKVSPSDTAVDADLEVVDFMVGNPNISTAYVRNGPMVTLWELGAIHRGAPWQTLNLSAYNSDVSVNEGMGDYDKGDANLLEQVKLNTNTEITGRININTAHYRVLKGLLTGIPVNCSYATPDSPLAGTGANYYLTEDQAQWIAFGNPSTLDPDIHSPALGSIIKSSNSGTPFRERGKVAIADNLRIDAVFPSGINCDSDRKSEEIIGKFVGLTTIRTNHFVVVIVAQSIKDLDSGVMGGVKGIYNQGVDRILAERKIMAYFSRDVFTNELRMERYEYIID